MNKPIALFDSGVGGLTVLQEIIKILPKENCVYLADNGFFPYGTKYFNQLENRLRKVVHYLLSLDVKAIVVACNTASLHIKSIVKLAKIPVIDVILPTCNKVVQTTHNKKVCLLATDATIKAGRYQQILGASGVDVLSVACSDFVPLAENGMSHTPQAYDVIRCKLEYLSNIPFDTVILGCTHFGLLKEPIANVLGDRHYVECGMPTALKLCDVLRQNNLLYSGGQRDVSLLTTGNVAVFDNFAHTFPFDFANAKVAHID